MVDVLASLLPLMLLQVLFAIFAALIARRVGASPTVWFIVSIIPVVGFFFGYYVIYKITVTVLDRLEAINTKLTPSTI